MVSTQPLAATVERVRTLRALRRFLHAGRDELRRHQSEALVHVVDAAFQTEAYQALYGRRPRIEGLEDLSELPLTDRSYLAGFSLKDRTAALDSDAEKSSSSGSTGDVMVSLISPQEATYDRALAARQWQAQRVPHGRLLTLDFSMAPASPMQVDGLNARVPGWGPLEVQAQALGSFRPRVLHGPPSCLLELGEFTGGTPVDMIVTYGEHVTAEDRMELRRFYSSSVIDVYAASEVGLISWECPTRTGYHVNAESVIVEVLDDEGRPLHPGETGNLVLTSLSRLMTPIVRYQIGDIGAVLPGPCPCGVTLPLMCQVEGRQNDRPLTHDGRRISPMRMLIGNIGPYHQAIRRWRVVQRSVGDILVEVVWRGEPLPEFPTKMAETYERVLGGPIDLEFLSVDRLSAPRGKKYRYVESLV